MFVWKREWERVVVLWKIFQRPCEMSTVWLRCIKQVRICSLWYKARWFRDFSEKKQKKVDDVYYILADMVMETELRSQHNLTLCSYLFRLTWAQEKALFTQDRCWVAEFLAIKKWAGILFNLNKRWCGFLVTRNHKDCQWINLERKVLISALGFNSKISATNSMPAQWVHCISALGGKNADKTKCFWFLDWSLPVSVSRDSNYWIDLRIIYNHWE